MDHNVIAAHLTRCDSEVPNAVDGTGDNMVWNDSEEDGNVSSECEEDEGTDCAYGDSATNW